MKQKDIQEAMPGLPDGVLNMIDERPVGEVCGNCTAFNPETGLCEERRVAVRARDPGCMLFVKNGG